jgi:hypothetical protein
MRWRFFGSLLAIVIFILSFQIVFAQDCNIIIDSTTNEDITCASGRIVKRTGYNHDDCFQYNDEFGGFIATHPKCCLTPILIQGSGITPEDELVGLCGTSTSISKGIKEGYEKETKSTGTDFVIENIPTDSTSIIDTSTIPRTTEFTPESATNPSCEQGYKRNPNNPNQCLEYINNNGNCESIKTDSCNCNYNNYPCSDPIRNQCDQSCNTCNEEYRRPDGYNSYSCQIKNKETGCTWKNIDINECLIKNIQGDFNCEKDDIFKSLDNSCSSCNSENKIVNGECLVKNDNTNCVFRATSNLCECYNENMDCSNPIAKACSSNCESVECLTGYHRQSYNTDTCGIFQLINNQCTFVESRVKSNCLGIDGTDSCVDDPIRIKSGKCPNCVEEFRRSENNANDCYIRNYDTKCEWQSHSNILDCSNVYGTNDCNDPIYASQNLASCDLSDSDNDGIFDIFDLCSNTLLDDITDKDGCSCSQKSCDDNNICTVDICTDGICQNMNNDYSTCGTSRNCNVDSCDSNFPYEFLDYPESGHDYCYNGACTQYNCELVESYPDETCDIETPRLSITQICEESKDNDNDDICLPIDNCPDIANPNQIDTDLDGIGDACDLCPNDAYNDMDNDNVCDNVDNCLNVANENQIDSDYDGYGDLCDLCPNDITNDLDFDSICTTIDNCPEKYNPDQRDCDNNLIGDACDVNSLCSEDSDNDNINDVIDNCPLLSNPDQSDFDNDFIGDKCDPCVYDPRNDIDNDKKCANIDNCPNIANPDQSDFDQDSIGDKCDLCDYDPFNDQDNDNKCANLDNCPLKFNPSQSDCDADNIGDACDLISVCSIDSDTDLIPDVHDNCVLIMNQDQLDSDSDKIGDKCDTCPYDPFNDIDNDGVCGNVDNCETISNPTQIDSDNDNLGNVCDNCISDINNDIDNDGICGNVDNCPLKFNFKQLDCDFNGIGDACDKNSKCASDFDDDDILNYIDNCPEDSNRNQNDRDGDKIGDVCDVCINDPYNDIDNDNYCSDVDNCKNLNNPSQLDSDNDLIGNACDLCIYDSENDIDNDKICGEFDNCRYKFNPTQSDCDLNDIGDACDIDSTCVIDSDKDNYIDYDDNCPNIANNDQIDTDNDNIGDVCDICPNDYFNDIDKDGYCSEIDNCPLLFNSDQIDTDNDGLGNSCDLCINDPNNDIDEDGYCADHDTCPNIYNPNQEKDCSTIKLLNEEYDQEINVQSTNNDIKNIVKDSLGSITLTENRLESYNDVKNNIKIESKEHYMDNKLYTKYKITIDTKKSLHDFSYYQHIPKCIAEKTNNIFFKGKNYEIIQTDPIIAWHFSDVNEKIEMTYEVEGIISDECLDTLKDFAYSSNTIEKEKPNNTINFVLAVISIILLIIIFVYRKKKVEIELMKNN